MGAHHIVPVNARNVTGSGRGEPVARPFTSVVARLRPWLPVRGRMQPRVVGRIVGASLCGRPYQRGRPCTTVCERPWVGWGHGGDPTWSPLPIVVARVRPCATVGCVGGHGGDHRIHAGEPQYPWGRPPYPWGRPPYPWGRPHRLAPTDRCVDNSSLPAP